MDEIPLELPIACHVAAESWPIAGSFTISRGSKTAADVVVVELASGGLVGRGECVPYPRYGESVDGVLAAIRAELGTFACEGTHDWLNHVMPAGAARNALDCALWELRARTMGIPVWSLAGLPSPRPVPTAVTVGIDTPQAMAAKAAGWVATYGPDTLLKVKVGADAVAERLEAVRAAAPAARLIVDANEAWGLDQLRDLLPRLEALRVDLIEQPLPAGADDGLDGLGTPAVPLCADESVHTAAGLDVLARRYQAINLKLDKTGGFTEALRLRERAKALGLGIMVGCMVGTSLAMAPAVLLAADADFVDLDGPLMLQRDRAHGLRYDGGRVHPPDADLWG